MPSNQLVDETSPYLLQHKDNPVHWRPWSRAALDEAKAGNKPILLSVGYAACHWCHVMAHESFENEVIAGVMNEFFVNIKVDREERPDLDVIYQTALALMGEQGGWPLTMFLTPDGDPFWGGTYFPATARYGRPAFPDLLYNVSEIYRTQRDKVEDNVSSLRAAIDKLSQPEGADGLSAGLLDGAADIAAGVVDRVDGGTHGAPKFPQVSFFQFLWRSWLRTGKRDFREAVTVSLDRMCQGGIYDHLGGGFARYSTDSVWLAPHFEKMLYDNALLVELLTDAWLDTGSPLYAVRVRETVSWMLGDMRVEDSPGDDGLFALASAYDADSEGEEGKYYVWNEAGIDALLEDEAALFKKHYDVVAGGNWEGHTILNRTALPELADAATEARLADLRQVLLSVRSRRVPPLWDDKVLADWNGLAIAALAKAGAAFGEPSWTEAAEKIFAFICRRLSAAGRLNHSWREGRAKHAAVLDDYANMARAALALYEISGSPEYLDQAEAWTETVNRHYWDAGNGGYFLSADDTDDVITRSKTIADNATPSGNGTMAEVLARLFHMTGKEAYRERAEHLIQVFSSHQPEHLTNTPGLMAGYELLDHGVQIVIAGETSDVGCQGLLQAALEAPLAARVITRLAGDIVLTSTHPAYGKGPVDGKAAAYVCAGQACGLPVTDAGALRVALAAL
ncbi:MAG: thioredoxin domain-containing protein [Rhodospirillales bacterium]|nr:thioredoxin domain-containing protein [Rhodospirillales bacterium]